MRVKNLNTATFSVSKKEKCAPSQLYFRPCRGTFNSSWVLCPCYVLGGLIPAALARSLSRARRSSLYGFLTDMQLFGTEKHAEY